MHFLPATARSSSFLFSLWKRNRIVDTDRFVADAISKARRGLHRGFARCAASTVCCGRNSSDTYSRSARERVFGSFISSHRASSDTHPPQSLGWE